MASGNSKAVSEYKTTGEALAAGYSKEDIEVFLKENPTPAMKVAEKWMSANVTLMKGVSPDGTPLSKEMLGEIMGTTLSFFADGSDIVWEQLSEPKLKAKGTTKEIFGAAGKYWGGMSYGPPLGARAMPGEDDKHATVAFTFGSQWAVDGDQKEIAGTRSGANEIHHHVTLNDAGKIIAWKQTYDEKTTNDLRKRLDAVGNPTPAMKVAEKWMSANVTLMKGVSPDGTPLSKEMLGEIMGTTLSFFADGSDIVWEQLSEPKLKAKGTTKEIFGAAGKYWGGMSYGPPLGARAMPGEDDKHATVAFTFGSQWAVDGDQKEIAGTRSGANEIHHHVTLNDAGKIIAWKQTYDEKTTNDLREAIDSVSS